MTVPQHLAEQAGCEPVREIGAMAEGLHTLAQWMLPLGGDMVALESIGVYWIVRRESPDSLFHR